MSNISITTDRIKIRLIEPSDLDSIHNLHSLPETDKFNALGIPKNVMETKTIIEQWISEHQHDIIENYTFLIQHLKSNEFIGLIGLKLGSKKYKNGMVWYKIHKDSWKQGYATESLRAIIDYSFDTLNLHRLEAGCAVENIASIKVLEKVGMVKEGRGRKILPLKSGWSDNFTYSILETDLRK